MELANALSAIRCINATAAGTTTVNGTAVDMQGYDGVIFIALIGANVATATTSMKAQQGAASNGSDAADIAGSSSGVMTPSTDDNKMLILDVFRPSARYVRPVIVRGTANGTIDGVLAIRYRALKEPTSDDATVKVRKVLISPALGTP